MEDRLAVRPAHDAPRAGGYGASERDESDEEKVYYGFGVFMGLPLADLRAMKEEYLQKQAQHGGAMVSRGATNGNGNGGVGALPPGVGPSSVPRRGPPVGLAGGAPPGAYGEYEVRDPMGRSHGMVRGGGAHAGRGAPMQHPSAREMDPRMMAAAGGGQRMMHPQHAHHPQHYGGGAPYGGAPGNGHHSDDGDSSDGSYSAPKSHSLNFILH